MTIRISLKVFLLFTSVFIKNLILNKGITNASNTKPDFLSLSFDSVVKTRSSISDKGCVENIGNGVIAPSVKQVSKRYYGLSPGFSVAGGCHGGHGHLGFLGSGGGHKSGHSEGCRSHDDHGYGYPEGSHGMYAGGGVSFSEHSEPNCMMQHNSRNGHIFHGGALHMDCGGHLSRAHHGIHGHGIGGGGGHGGHPDHNEENDHSCGGFCGGGGGHQIMQIPLAPLPQGYHEGLGPPEHECEEHHDDDCEQEEREHDYEMDRGGCDEGHWITKEKNHKESDLETDQPQSLSQTASHSSNNKVHGEAKEIDGSVVSGLVNNQKDTETATDVGNDVIKSEEMSIVSAGFKGHRGKYNELQWDQDVNGKEETGLHHDVHHGGYENRHHNYEQKKTFKSNASKYEQKSKDASKVVHSSDQIALTKNVTKYDSKKEEAIPIDIQKKLSEVKLSLEKNKTPEKQIMNLSTPRIALSQSQALEKQEHGVLVNHHVTNQIERQSTSNQDVLAMPLSIVSPHRSILPSNSSLVDDSKSVKLQQSIGSYSSKQSTFTSTPTQNAQSTLKDNHKIRETLLKKQTNFIDIGSKDSDNNTISDELKVNTSLNRPLVSSGNHNQDQNKQFTSFVKANPSEKYLPQSNSSSGKDKSEYSFEYSTGSSNFESKSEFNKSGGDKPKYSFKSKYVYKSKYPQYNYEYNYGTPFSQSNGDDANNMAKESDEKKEEKIEKEEKLEKEKSIKTSALDNKTRKTKQEAKVNEIKTLNNSVESEKDYQIQSVNRTLNESSKDLEVVAPLLQSVLPLENPRPDDSPKITVLKASPPGNPKPSRLESKKKSPKVVNTKQAKHHNNEKNFPSIEDNTPQAHPSKIQDALTENNNNKSHDNKKPLLSKLASLVSFIVKKKRPYGSILKEDNLAFQPLTVHSKGLDLIISPVRCDNCERRLVDGNIKHLMKPPAK